MYRGKFRDYGIWRFDETRKTPLWLEKAILEIKGLECVTEEAKTPTPFVFENIPQWIKVSGRELYTGFEIIQKENNIIAMTAPYGGSGEYTEAQISYLFKTALTAFSAACKQSYLSKRKRIVIHTGNWGCGNCGNNNELIYLIQILAAFYAGVATIVFHAVDEISLNSAKEKFVLMPEKLTLKKLIESLLAFKFLWQKDEIKEALEKLGLHYGMTEQDLKEWKKIDNDEKDT